jgi:membrane-bound lytic murein transglycosylase B
METKLRELFGIFFRSELTKEIQEKLYQLGYDLAIDGRNGPGTRSVMEAFVRDKGLKIPAKVGPAFSAALDPYLAAGRVRTLQDYRPPPPKRPSRTATHSQFTNPGALTRIKAHYLEDKAIFDRVERAYGVPGPVICSIMWIETGYGSYFGKNKAAMVLSSMAASSDYRLIAPYVSDLAKDSEAQAFLKETSLKRGLWALAELKALLSHAWANSLDPMGFPGSIYGAIGYGQFMPSNVGKFAVDGNGDQIIDLFNKTDAIYSIANYLRGNGWTGDMSDEEKRREAIRRYNNSGVYINTVLYVADYLWSGQN